MRPKITYYFTYELRKAGGGEVKRGGLVFKSVSIHPEHFTRSNLWPEVMKIEPEYTDARGRGYEIHDWGYEDVTYRPIEIEDKEF